MFYQFGGVCNLVYERRSGSVVSVSHLGPEGREFKPKLAGAPMCINGNQQTAWGQPDKMLGGNLRSTSIPSRGNRYTPSHFILQELQISAGVMGLLACLIAIGGRL